jgi:hypothetical protein
VVIEAFVLDAYDQPRTLYAHLFVDGDGDDYDPRVPDDLWKVRFDWHTPSTPGPVEIRVEATDLGGQSDANTQVFWIGEPPAE